MLTRLAGSRRTSGATEKLRPTGCPGVGYGSCPTISTRTSANGCWKARSTRSPAGRYRRPAATSDRRKSPMASMRSATGSRASAQPVSTISRNGRPAIGHNSMSNGGPAGWLEATADWATVTLGSSRERGTGLRSLGGDPMDDVGDRLLDLVHDLDEVARCLTPDQAHAQFDETTLQVFWKRWPEVSAWAGSLWRLLSEELSGPSAPHMDPELDEVGDSG